MNYTITEAQRQQLLDAFESVAGKGKRCEAGMDLLQSLAPVDAEPATRQYQARDDSWQPFLNDKHYADTKADGTWPIRALYTHPAATVDAEPVGYAYANQDFIGSVIGAKGEWAPHEIALYTRPAPLRELTDDDIVELAHRVASKYTHSYGFVKHTLVDFVRKVEAHIKGQA